MRDATFMPKPAIGAIGSMSLDPMALDSDLEAQRDRLNNRFQQGLSARYEDILAGCDIPRRGWLDRIGAGFRSQSVVIVNSPSGQGKSALAYRWLQDQTPDMWRLEIKRVGLLPDRNKAALAAALRASAFP